MKLEAFGVSSATITLSKDELWLLNNALNEVCNGVRELGDRDEFATRLGASRERARAVLVEIHEVIQCVEGLPE